MTDIAIRGMPVERAEHNIAGAIGTLLERNGAFRYEETELGVGPREMAETHLRLEGALMVVMPR